MSLFIFNPKISHNLSHEGDFLLNDTIQNLSLFHIHIKYKLTEYDLTSFSGIILKNTKDDLQTFILLRHERQHEYSKGNLQEL